MTRVTVIDLARVIYSSGKVFDGLSTGRISTENFLRTGSTDGVTSRADLALLEDLRDVAQFIVSNAHLKVNATYVKAVNTHITRSGPLHPGQLRRAAQEIGVDTTYGRHQPPALDDAALEELIEQALSASDPVDAALSLFVALARAQPFEDGNKRTALFAANSYLIHRATGLQLSVPVDEADPTLARKFNDFLARAYIFDETVPVMSLMREHGVSSTPTVSEQAPAVLSPNPDSHPRLGY